MIFLRCSGVSWLMCTSVYTPCSFIDLISCFIPSIVCSLSKPSVLLTQGSRRIFSACISCSSSLEVASIFCPFFVVTVTCEILILVVGGSWAVSGRLAAVALSVVLACFGELPCVISSVTSLLPCVGIGSACFACWVAGAVAIGRSVSAGGVVVCGCTEAFGCGLCWVCVLVVVCCFAAAVCGSTTMLGVVGGIMAGEELMMSINCLLYLSGFICLLMVLALITLLLMPSMFSFVELSLPSQMAG